SVGQQQQPVSRLDAAQVTCALGAHDLALRPALDCAGELPLGGGQTAYAHLTLHETYSSHKYTPRPSVWRRWPRPERQSRSGKRVRKVLCRQTASPWNSSRDEAIRTTDTLLLTVRTSQGVECNARVWVILAEVVPGQKRR